VRHLVILFLVLFVLTVGADVFAPYEPYQTDPGQSLQAPSVSHPLGTDLLGRDVLSRLLFGGRRTLAIALAATALAVIAGNALGMLMGYVDVWWSGVIRWVMVSILAVPGLVLSLAVITLTGPGPAQIALAVGFAQVAFVAQVMQTSVRQARESLFVESSIAMGAGQFWIMTRHLLPSVLPTLLSYGAATLSYTVIQSAALSFLGMGGDLSVPDWGVMLAEGRDTLQTAPWISLAPGMMLVFSISLFNHMTVMLGRTEAG
jgi:peptide/nickel transport system permease protein